MRRVTGRRQQNGSGLFPTLFGAFVMLVFLVFSIQLAVGMYAGSMVQAAAFDAARSVAENPADPATTVASAETSLRTRLGSEGAKATIAWDLSDPQQVSLYISTPRPVLVPAGFVRAFESPNYTRTIKVKREAVHP